jgi:DNA ligase-1
MKISEILNKLKETNSRLEKEQILSDNKENSLFRKVLQYAYDPFKVFYIQKLFENTAFGYIEFEELENVVFDLLDKLHERLFTGNEAKSQIMLQLSQCTLECFGIFKGIINKDLRIGLSEKTINKVYGKDFIKTFNVQLANKYDENKEYEVDYWWINQKMDGLRANWNNCIFLTRNGKQIIGFEHVENELQEIAKKYNIEMFDGELFSKSIPFQTIQSYVMQRKNIDVENKEKIKYNVFALTVKDKSYKTTASMYQLMQIIKDTMNLEYVEILMAERVDNDKNEIFKQTEKYIQEGFEGAMLRHPFEYYNEKRSDALLKVKFMKEIDLIVADIQEGTGKYKGMLGALLCESFDGKIKTEVGSGFSDMDREMIWNNFNDYKGKFIEVKYQELTDNKESLRFPVYNGFKLDR